MEFCLQNDCVALFLLRKNSFELCVKHCTCLDQECESALCASFLLCFVWLIPGVIYQEKIWFQPICSNSTSRSFHLFDFQNDDRSRSNHSNRICPNQREFLQICPIFPEFVWVCPNVSEFCECIRICVNSPEYIRVSSNLFEFFKISPDRMSMQANLNINKKTATSSTIQMKWILEFSWLYEIHRECTINWWQWKIPAPKSLTLKKRLTIKNSNSQRTESKEW